MKLAYKVDGKIQDVGVHHGDVQVVVQIESIPQESSAPRRVPSCQYLPFAMHRILNKYDLRITTIKVDTFFFYSPFLTFSSVVTRPIAAPSNPVITGTTID